jgi:hypothetical protein
MADVILESPAMDCGTYLMKRRQRGALRSLLGGGERLTFGSRTVKGLLGDGVLRVR